MKDRAEALCHRWHSPLGLLTLLVLLLAATPARAAVTDYLDKPIAEVHLQTDTAEVRDPALLAIIETRVGEPLTMVHVRETLAHLFGLGRYQDIQVDASLNASGVVLTYRLSGIQRVRRVAFEGSLELPQEDLRRLVTDRFGATPSLGRAPLIVAALQALYRDRGYPRAQISSHAVPDADGGSATLVFAVQPGVRAHVGAIDVEAPPSITAQALLADIALKTGDAYDGVQLDAKLNKYVERLRDEGYYEARATHLTRFGEGDAAVSVVVSVEPGPHVELSFQGDPLTARERDELVPIAREHSVNEDILEDGKFAIEGHFRALGYCAPRADYERKQDAGVLRIVFTVTRGPQCQLDSVDIEGNSSLQTAELRPLVLSAIGQPFIENTLGADMARIQGYYRRRGFSDVKVAVNEDRGAVRGSLVPVHARLTITEGPRRLVRSIAFDGNTAVPEDELRRHVSSAVGQPYFGPQIAADTDTLGSFYLNRGYQQASVEPSARLAPDGSVDLHFIVHEGPQIIVDHVLIVGNARTRTDAIEREVAFKTGEPLSQQFEDDTRARISGMGLFRRIDISYLQLPGQPDHRDVLITVEEAPLTSIEYGGGLEGGKKGVFDPATGGAKEKFQLAPRGFFGVGRRNLFGGDRSLNLFTRVSLRPETATAEAPDRGGYGFSEYLARLTYQERRIFETPTDGTLSAALEQTSRTSFDFNRRIGNLTFGRRLAHSLALSGRYSIEHTRVFNIQNVKPSDIPLIDRLFPQVRLSIFSGSMIRDTRDDALDPSKGGLVGLDGEVAARNVGSQVGFFKTFMQGFAYRRLPGAGGAIAAFGARVGLATGFPRFVTTTTDTGGIVTTKVDDLPASERFFAGGDTTVRGFALDRLGTAATIDSQGFPKGGHGLVVLNAELRGPAHRGLSLVGFVDGGNVFLHVNDMRFGDLRAAAGFGIRYRSPIGPIRVDLGIKLSRQTLPNGQQERPTALHISLGQAF